RRAKRHRRDARAHLRSRARRSSHRREGGLLKLADRYLATRHRTMDLAAPLRPEDMVLQSMPDASPTKWHLAHTTWFFETFVLRPFEKGFRAIDPAYEFLFNSYYEAVGPRQPRAERGLSRPSIDQVQSYRAAIDERVIALIATREGDPEVADRL